MTASQTAWASHVRISSVLVLCGALLGGCGGGGSSSSVAPPPGTTFPLQSALASWLASGYTKTATLSGTASYLGASYPISGSLALSASPLTSSGITFDGLPASSTTLSVNGSVSVAGQTLSLTSTQQSYFSTTLQPLGYSSSSAYCVAASPGSYPATVQVGDAATVVTYDCFSDSSMTTATGKATVGFSVGTAYSSTTATISLTEVETDTAGNTVSRSTDNYVISTAGTLDLVSGSALQTDSGVTLDMTLAIQ